jgi:hypothetical protein
VAFTFTETSSDPKVLTGMQALALEVGMKRGINKLSAVRTG